MSAISEKTQPSQTTARRTAPRRKRIRQTGSSLNSANAQSILREPAWSKLAFYLSLIAAPAAAILLLLCIWQIGQNLQSASTAIPPANADFIVHAESAAEHSANAKMAFGDFPRKQAPIFKPNPAGLSANMHYLHKGLVYSALLVLASAFCFILLLLNYKKREKYYCQTQQNLLEHTDVLAENRVRRRTAKLEAARRLAEKERQRAELLLQDTSHRVGNSLATVSSLLGLQLSQCHDEAGKQALLSAQSRIQAIAAAHRRLRLGRDMETASAGEFLSAVIHDVESGLSADKCGNITIKTHFEHHYLPARDVTTLGIILGELLTNAVKHAFPNGRQGQIYVAFGKMGAKHLRLIVEDNGVGVPPELLGKTAAATDNKGRNGNPGKSRGLGRLILEQLSAQFNSRPHYSAAKNGGTKIVIPIKNIQ